jgi:hypothetical protein
VIENMIEQIWRDGTDGKQMFVVVTREYNDGAYVCQTHVFKTETEASKKLLGYGGVEMFRIDVNSVLVKSGTLSARQGYGFELINDGDKAVKV